MYGLDIQVNQCASALPHILNDATRHGSIWTEVLYLTGEKLGVKIIITKFGNDIFDLLWTWQNVKQRIDTYRDTLSSSVPGNLVIVCKDSTWTSAVEGIVWWEMCSRWEWRDEISTHDCTASVMYAQNQSLNSTDSKHVYTSCSYASVLLAVGHDLIFNKPNLKENFRNINLSRLQSLGTVEKK